MTDEALIQKTIEVWQPRYPHKLTREDALIIIENLDALLDLLERYAKEEVVFFRQLMYWMPYEDTSVGFEYEDGLWTRLLMPYNVPTDGNATPHAQALLDNQASR